MVDFVPLLARNQSDSVEKFFIILPLAGMGLICYDRVGVDASMKLAFTGLCRMSTAARRILTGGLLGCCTLLWLAVLTAISALPYSAQTYSLFRQAEALESGASVVLFCAVFLAAFAEERLGRR